MAADGCLGTLPHPECVVFPRRDVFLAPDQASQDEPALWNRSSGGNPLASYQLVSHVELPTKGMAWLHCSGGDVPQAGTAGSPLLSLLSRRAADRQDPHAGGAWPTTELRLQAGGVPHAQPAAAPLHAVMVDPSKTMSPNVHYTSVCTGTPTIVSNARKAKLRVRMAVWAGFALRPPPCLAACQLNAWRRAPCQLPACPPGCVTCPLQTCRAYRARFKQRPLLLPVRTRGHHTHSHTQTHTRALSAPPHLCSRPAACARAPLARTRQTAAPGWRTWATCTGPASRLLRLPHASSHPTGCGCLREADSRDLGLVCLPLVPISHHLPRAIPYQVCRATSRARNVLFAAVKATKYSAFDGVWQHRSSSMAPTVHRGPSLVGHQRDRHAEHQRAAQRRQC